MGVLVRAVPPGNSRYCSAPRPASADRVAFVGVDANDSSAAARTFLKEFPLPYPSYSDPNQDISRMLGATAGFPATAFY